MGFASDTYTPVKTEFPMKLADLYTFKARHHQRK